MASNHEKAMQKLEETFKFLQKEVEKHHKYGWPVKIDNFMESISSDFMVGYERLDYLEKIFHLSKKFREYYVVEGLELVFEEFEEITGKKIQWLRDAVWKRFGCKLKDEEYQKLLFANPEKWDEIDKLYGSKSLRKLRENRLYGTIIYGLVVNGSSQKNSIEFFSKVTGKKETVIRDSYYEVKRILKNFNLNAVDKFSESRIQAFIRKNEKVILRVLKDPNFAKSLAAFNRLQNQLEAWEANMQLSKDKAVLRIKAQGYKIESSKQNKNA